MMKTKFLYRLALDIGTTSIGWAVLRLNPTFAPCQIIRAGVRIFGDGRNPKDGTSLAVTRREARQARRRRDRLLRRKQKLIDLLIKIKFFPEADDERFELVNLDPYHIRRKALNEPITPQEMARALFHLNQRRGFKSNRKTDTKDNDTGLMKSTISQMKQILTEGNYRTLGEWLADRHDQLLSVRARLKGENKTAHYDFYADRSMVENEINQLWETQQGFNPTVYTDELLAQIKDVILFQRRLRPVKAGRCTLLPELERAPLALPCSQQVRLLQELNHLRLMNADLTDGRALTLDERDAIYRQLNQVRKLTFTKIKSLLKLGAGTRFNLESEKRTELKGNITGEILSKSSHFGGAWFDFSDDLQHDIVERLLNVENESELIEWLMSHTGIDANKAEVIANASLPEGYGNLSKTALQRIQPHLLAGVHTYDTAVRLAGFDSHSALSHQQQTGELLDQLPYYGELLQRHVAFGTGNPQDPVELRFGKIANPTVHIGLNQLRLVVNELIKQYGRPTQIVIELARDLHNGKKRRDEIAKEQARLQALNDAYKRQIGEHFRIDPINVKRTDIQKMRLWVELNPSDVSNRCCTFTGEPISMAKLLSEEIEIEHLLPYSRTLDDGFNNKTVCYRRANRFKKNRTPDEAFNNDEAKQAGYDYQDILKRAQSLPKEKARRFAVGAYQHWLKHDSDFLARALNDTRYISRLATEYLSSITLPNMTYVVTGTLTGKLRYALGLNHLLSGTDEKTRNDHRHHALDAVVIGLTDRSLLQQVASNNARLNEQGVTRLLDNFTPPWTSFVQDTKRILDAIKVSHKPDHGYQGQLHEDTAHAPNSGRGVVEIRESEDKKRIRRPLDDDGRPLPFKKYVGGNNYCIEIVRADNGKWQGEVISRFQAYQIVRDLDLKEGAGQGIKQLRHPLLSQSGRPLVMRLCRDDVVQMDIDGHRELFRLVKISGSTGQMVFAPIVEANVDKRNSDKEDAFKYTTKYAGSFQKANGRFCTLSPTGQLRRY